MPLDRTFEGFYSTTTPVVGAYLSTLGIRDPTNNTLHATTPYPHPELAYSQFIGGIDAGEGGSVADMDLGDPEGVFKNDGHIHVRDPDEENGADDIEVFQAAQAKVLSGTGSGGNIFYLGGHVYSVSATTLDRSTARA